jgi:hypothetical protein
LEKEVSELHIALGRIHCAVSGFLNINENHKCLISNAQIDIFMAIE